MSAALMRRQKRDGSELIKPPGCGLRLTDSNDTADSFVREDNKNYRGHTAGPDHCLNWAGSGIGLGRARIARVQVVSLSAAT